MHLTAYIREVFEWRVVVCVYGGDGCMHPSISLLYIEKEKAANRVRKENAETHLPGEERVNNSSSSTFRKVNGWRRMPMGATWTWW